MNPGARTGWWTLDNGSNPCSEIPAKTQDELEAERVARIMEKMIINAEKHRKQELLEKIEEKKEKEANSLIEALKKFWT